MKLNIYINKLIRRIEKKIGKQETLKALKITRKTTWQWGKQELTSKQLEQVCYVASEKLGEDMRVLFMDGLVRLTEDTMKRKDIKDQNKLKESNNVP